ncbi:mechanosensitive ion channel family protein [uncultured Salinisphaera sp.]|uniref:mechanosensitive ion channel family protein n=1 Tax=uncultured Salinisphaera sp. TaxID=359372 RepID=UPI0032B14239|tara:strand:- start:632 stop:1891 length:1260 start_codon:yes stop_codon:yes gene_type:complete
MIDTLLSTYHDFIARYLSIKSEWGTLIDVAAILGLTALLDLTTRLALRLLHDKVLATRNLWDDALYRSVNGPLQILLWIGGMTLAIRVGTSAEHPWRDYVPLMRGVLIALVFIWFAFRLIASVEKNALARAASNYKHLDNTSADALAKLARAVVLVIGALVLLEQFGVSPSSLLAFSGVGGIAVGFAARDVLANIFGGMTVYLNRPFSVGDWIRSPDRDIEGVVEDIGWRATTVRRFDMRPLYVPNAVFSNVALENPSRMSHRLINEKIAVRFEDAARVPDIVADIRHMLDQDDSIDSDQVILTYLDSFGDSSLDLLIYCYTVTTDWAEYLAIKQSVLQRAQDKIREHGASVSLPTQIVHLPDGASSGDDADYAAEPADADEQDIDTQKVQSERDAVVASERNKAQGEAGPDHPGEQGS